MLSNLDKLVSCDRPADCILCLCSEVNWDLLIYFGQWVVLLAFHQALISNPQDAFVIWVFASVLYNGKWEEDEELAAKVTELASLVQDCVNGLTFNETHSYMAFVSKKIGEGVGQIFDVLANSFESYDKGRKSFMIDYHLLGKGYIPETRFVLGKIILKTISVGLVGGEREVDEEKKIKSLLDSVEESGHPRPCDLTENEFLSKKNRKHSLTIPDSESNLERTKKQKLSGKEHRLSQQKLNMNKQDKFSKKDSHQKGKELQNFVETCLLAEEETMMTQENISEKKDCHSSLEEVISKKINRHKNVVKEKNSSRPPLPSLFR
ncbi:hypothetical protein Pint_28697 [Pistacia integerrima]|uniref:Uncharacterized protein n=1 Tax=Pistacia integerrima TaxID=434235 RepID=A0ACC0YV53_9ROSI|nr:hypothetical protein Pint_28697 [Pistacia integerrima]